MHVASRIALFLPLLTGLAAAPSVLGQEPACVASRACATWAARCSA
jgi:hypothetical protein